MNHGTYINKNEFLKCNVELKKPSCRSNTTVGYDVCIASIVIYITCDILYIMFHISYSIYIYIHYLLHIHYMSTFHSNMYYNMYPYIVYSTYICSLKHEKQSTVYCLTDVYK